MRSQPEQSPEVNKEWAGNISVEDIITRSGLSATEFKSKAIEVLLKKEVENEKKERLFRKKFHIDNDLTLEQALQEKVDQEFEEFQRLLPEKKKMFEEQLKHCLSVAAEKGYLQKPSQPFSILITHPLLKAGSDYYKGAEHDNSFDPDENIISITIDSPNILLAHEIGHALSTSNEEGRSGFQALKKEGAKTISHGNKWITEGMTVFWENLSANDDKKIPQRSEEGDAYQWYQQAAKLILVEIKMPEEDALKAYFGDPELTSMLRQKVRERFNCTLEDLDCLSYNSDIDWTKRVISGQPVEINVKSQTYDRIKSTLTKLTRLFPNVTVNQK